MSLGGGESAGARPHGVYELGDESDLNPRQWGLQKAWKLEECGYICVSFLTRQCLCPWRAVSVATWGLSCTRTAF